MNAMRRVLATTTVLLAAAAGGVACGGGSSTPGGTGGSGNGVSATGGGSAIGTGGAGGGGAGGAGSGFTKDAVCGQRGRAMANASSYDGYEEFFLTAESGLGDDLCVVKFDLKRVGAAPAGCTDCEWTHLVEYSNPTVVKDIDGVCARSELALTMAAITKLVGSRVATGYVPEFEGAHGSAQMRYWDATGKWDIFGNATWDMSTNMFRYDYRDGLCNY